MFIYTRTVHIANSGGMDFIFCVEKQVYHYIGDSVDINVNVMFDKRGCEIVYV